MDETDDGVDIFDGRATGFGTPGPRAAWAPKPLLTREQVLFVGDGETHLVRLSRLWPEEPQVQYEGEALIRRDRDLLNVIAPGISWAEYSTRDDFEGDSLIAEDYLLEFLKPGA
jgi:hypothetical protein